jgi:hypothetical protein
MSREGSRQKTVPGNSFIELLEGEEEPSINISQSNLNYNRIQGLDKEYSEELEVKEEQYKSERFKEEVNEQAQKTIDKLVSAESEVEMIVVKALDGNLKTKETGDVSN